MDCPLLKYWTLRHLELNTHASMDFSLLKYSCTACDCLFIYQNHMGHTVGHMWQLLMVDGNGILHPRGTELSSRIHLLLILV